MSVLFAAVPVKSLGQAKSRLSGSVANRPVFTLHMLERVLSTLRDTRVVTRVCVVSPDERVLAFASRFGAEGLTQTSEGLNEACAEAAEWARREGADALMVLHGDLPWVQPADIMAAAGLLAQSEEPHVAVIGPDHAGAGTNFLLTRPAGLIGFHFGPDSCASHQRAAQRVGATVHMLWAPGLAHDVDLPQDVTDMLGSACNE
jgi:2-phospho-L-lactate guanylyltransferase